MPSTYAKVLNVFSLIFAAIGVIAAIAVLASEQPAWIALCVLLVFAVYVILFLSAASMLDAAEKRNQLLEQIAKQIPASSASNPSAATATFHERSQADKPSERPLPKPKPSPVSDASAIKPTTPNGQFIQCPNCGQVQPAGRHVCWNCNLKFETEPTEPTSET